MFQPLLYEHCREEGTLTHPAGSTELWPFFTSAGTAALFLSQNHSLTKVGDLSMAYHPPPLSLNAVPKLLRLSGLTAQPLLQSLRMIGLEGSSNSCFTRCLQSIRYLKSIFQRELRRLTSIWCSPESCCILRLAVDSFYDVNFALWKIMNITKPETENIVHKILYLSPK